MLEVATALLYTTIFSKSKTIHRIERRRSVDPNRNPTKQSICQSLTKIRILKHRIRSRIRRLRTKNPILLIRRNRDVVRIVRVRPFHFRNNVLVPEELADVRVRADRERAVGVVGCILVDDHVVVGGAAGVVARENSFEARDAVGGGWLHAAQEGGVDVGEVVCVAVAGLDHAGVDACCVAVPGLSLLEGVFKDWQLLRGEGEEIPEIPIDVGQGLTSLDIQELCFKNDGYTCLPFLQIIADLLAPDPVWASLAAGADNASIGSPENSLVWRRRSVGIVGCVRLVEHSLCVAGLHRSFVLSQCSGATSGCAGFEVGEFTVACGEATAGIGVERPFCDEV